MRNLKRVLSLALALMMALSLMAFTGSASAAESATIPVASDLYPDYDQTNYPEAVDVITALKIVEGSDGQLLPNGTLTRAEATTIAARMLLGVNAAATLPNVGTVTGYTDVDSVDHWAAPYIAFCDNQGIVSGVGGGNFDPNGQLTGVAFGKVILTVLGYDADKEGLKGDSWATNVLVALANAGIKVEDSEGNPIDLTKPITREQAMEMTFQALQTPLVEYPALTINQGAIATKNGASFVTNNLAKTQTISNRKLTGNNYYTLEFAEKYFQSLVLKETTDPFGRPTHTWILSNVTIDEYDDNDMLVAEYDSLTTDVKISADLGNYYILTGIDGDDNNVVYEVNDYRTYDNTAQLNQANGYKILYQNSKTAKDLAVGAGKTGNEKETIAQKIASLTGNGTKVEVYVDDENIVTNIVVINYKVGTLNIARPVTNDRTNYSVTNTKWEGLDEGVRITSLTGSEFDDANVQNSVEYYEGAAKGDIVTCAKVDQVLYIYPTESFTGKQTNKHVVANTDEKTVEVTMDRTDTHTLGTALDGVKNDYFINSTNTATYYKDQYGFVVYTDKSTLSYAYIVAATGSTTNGVDGYMPSVQVRAVLEDGTVGVYDVRLTQKNGIWYLTSACSDEICDPDSDNSDAVKAKATTALGTNSKASYTVWDYTLNDDGTISLYKILPVSGGMAPGTPYYGTASNAIKKGTTNQNVNGQTLLMDSQTVFVVYNEYNKTAVKYTGNTNLNTDNTGLTNAKMVVVPTGADNETSYLVFATINKEESSQSLGYAYIYKSEGIDTDVDGTYTYEAYTPEGGIIKLTDERGSIVDATGVYTYDTSSNKIDGKWADGYWGGVDASGTSYLQGQTVKNIGSSLIQVGGKWLNVSNKAHLVYVEQTKADPDGCYAFVVCNKDNDAETIFVIPDKHTETWIPDSGNEYQVKAPNNNKPTDSAGVYEVKVNGSSTASAHRGDTITVTVKCITAPASGTDTVVVSSGIANFGNNGNFKNVSVSAGDNVGSFTFRMPSRNVDDIKLTVTGSGETGNVDTSGFDGDGTTPTTEQLKEALSAMKVDRVTVPSDVTLPSNIEVPAGKTLDVPNASKLNANTTITGNGTLDVTGSATGKTIDMGPDAKLVLNGQSTSQMPTITGTGTVTITSNVGAKVEATPGDLDSIMPALGVNDDHPTEVSLTGVEANEGGAYTVVVNLDKTVSFTANENKIMDYSSVLTLTTAAAATGGNASSTVSFYLLSIPVKKDASTTLLSEGAKVQIRYTRDEGKTWNSIDVDSGIFGAGNGTSISSSLMTAIDGGPLEVLIPVSSGVSDLQIIITPASGE